LDSQRFIGERHMVAPIPPRRFSGPVL